jgi:deazaflavin-dependent oxidoreductase (nitroreductase family)
MPLHGEYAPSPDDWSREQAELFERTNGAEGNEMQGKPIIVLTTLGAKSGKIRKTPLMRVEHDGEYVVVASKGGAPEHPTWFYNIVDAPLVELQDGAVRKDYTPRELSGEERDVWWERAVEAWPAYADYATKTDRLIPVFLLTPVE